MTEHQVMAAEECSSHFILPTLAFLSTLPSHKCPVVRWGLGVHAVKGPGDLPPRALQGHPPEHADSPSPALQPLAYAASRQCHAALCGPLPSLCHCGGDLLAERHLSLSKGGDRQVSVLPLIVLCSQQLFPAPIIRHELYRLPLLGHACHQ